MTKKKKKKREAIHASHLTTSNSSDAD